MNMARSELQGTWAAPHERQRDPASPKPRLCSLARRLIALGCLLLIVVDAEAAEYGRKGGILAP